MLVTIGKGYRWNKVKMCGLGQRTSQRRIEMEQRDGKKGNERVFQ